MPIKRSSLEQKWYFRLGKVLFLTLPLIVFLIVFLKGNITICNISSDNIIETFQNHILSFVIGLLAYYLILMAIWNILLYMIFGGVVNDTKPKNNQASQSVNPAAQPGTPAVQSVTPADQLASVKPKPAHNTDWIPITIFLVVAAIFVLWKLGYITLPHIDLGGADNSTVTQNSGSACARTSAELGSPCWETKNGAQTIGVLAFQRCGCPEDTKPTGDVDVVSPGGPYVMCACK